MRNSGARRLIAAGTSIRLLMEGNMQSVKHSFGTLMSGVGVLDSQVPPAFLERLELFEMVNRIGNEIYATDAMRNDLNLFALARGLSNPLLGNEDQVVRSLDQHFQVLAMQPKATFSAIGPNSAAFKSNDGQVSTGSGHNIKYGRDHNETHNHYYGESSPARPVPRQTSTLSTDRRHYLEEQVVASWNGYDGTKDQWREDVLPGLKVTLDIDGASDRDWDLDRCLDAVRKRK